METVIIFGVNGFSGIHFQKYIEKNHLSEKFRFIGVDIKIEKNSDIEYVEQNLLQSDNIASILKKYQPDYLINLVGSYNTEDFDKLYALNVGITQKILENIVNFKINPKKMLFIGSAAEYGDNNHLPLHENDELRPISPYGLTKTLQTQFIEYYSRKFKLNTLTARTFNILGKGIPRSLAIGSFLDQINKLKNNETMYVGNLNTKRDYLYIEDVIDAYWKLLLLGDAGTIYNISSGKSVVMRDLLNKMIELSGKKIQISVNPEFVHKTDLLDIYGDNSKISKLKWKAKYDVLDALKFLFQ